MSFFPIGSLYVVRMKNVKESLTDLAEVADAVEESWSIGAHEIEERALFFCDTSTESATAIATAAKALDLDDRLLWDWSKAIPGSDAIGLALRYDKKSVRLYNQYWVAIAAQVQGGDSSPFALYLGFKSLPDGTVRRDSYMCTPAAAPDVFWPHLSTCFTDFGLDKDQAQAVFRDLNAETAIFTQTAGDARQSWLTTVRRATIDRTALADWMAPLAKREGGSVIIDAARRSDLVHVAGGQDRTKGAFISFYFESDAQTVLSKLAAQNG